MAGRFATLVAALVIGISAITFSGNSAIAQNSTAGRSTSSDAEFSRQYGFFVGLHLAHLASKGDLQELLSATGQTTFEASASDEGFSAGIEAGFNYYFGSRAVLGVLGLANFGKTPNRYTFVGGANYLEIGRTYQIGLVARGGYQISPWLTAYLLAGVMITNQQYNIFFGGPIASQSAQLFGLAIGAELEAKVPLLSAAFGNTVTMGLRFLHVDWEKQKFNLPMTSATLPIYDYTGKVRENKIMLSFKFYFDGKR